MTLVATQVKRRRGTTAENDAFTGAEGEITVDLTTHELRVHDGSTVGGHTIPTKNYGYSKTENDNLLSNKANVAFDNLTSAGKKVCANMSMPSSSYDNLTLGASGTEYIAPANGYFFIEKVAGVTGNYYMSVYRDSPSYIRYVWFDRPAITTDRCVALCPVSKGNRIKIDYTITGTTNYFRFYYANGEA